MKKVAFIVLSLATLTACSQGIASMTDRTSSPCGDKPNCVSTQDSRDEFSVAPFHLTPNATMDAIEAVALTLPGAKTATKEADYLRIESTSKIMRFVDDLELKMTGDTLIVRSESRVGHSDFGVNRKRVEQLRAELLSKNLIK